MELTTVQNTGLDLDVLSRDSRGFTKIEARYQTIGSEVSAKINGQPAPPILSKILGGVLSELMGVFQYKVITFTITPTGRVVAIEGTEPIRQELREFFGRSSLRDNKAVLGLIDQYCSPAGFQNVLTLGNVLPPVALNLGDVYNYSSRLPDSVKFAPTMRVRRRMTQRAGGYATFEDLGTMEMSNAKVFTRNQPTTNSNLRGTLATTTKVDESSGLWVDTTTQMRGSGVTTMARPFTGEMATSYVTFSGSVHTTIDPRVEVPGIIYVD
jgi:hypothetical protein